MKSWPKHPDIYEPRPVVAASFSTNEQIAVLRCTAYLPERLDDRPDFRDLLQQRRGGRVAVPVLWLDKKGMARFCQEPTAERKPNLKLGGLNEFSA